MYQLMFGAGPAVLSRSLTLGLEHLLLALRAMPETAISWPSINGQRRSSDAIDARYGPPPAIFRGARNLLRVFGFLDGLRLQVQQPSDVELQELWYNGYVKVTNCENFFVWAPSGKCISAVVNYPGTVNDYRASQLVFHDLRDGRKTLPGNVLVGDIAFASAATNSIVATERYNPPGVDYSPWQSSYEKWRLVIRKGAEWGMRTLQALWPRITVPMSPDIEWNTKLLETVVRLTNLIASRMDSHCQLKSVYYDPMMRAPWQVNH